MKTLTSPISTEAASANSGWVEVFDFYLPSAVAAPWGTVSVLRLTSLPGGCAFFTPKVDPEPAGTQGAAATYHFWPVKRGAIEDKTKLENARLQITASNVTTEFAALLEDLEWESIRIVVRKTLLNLTGATADDCVVIAGVRVDSVRFSDEAIDFTCSTELGLFDSQLPAEHMHTTCRFRFGDDYCGLLRFKAENYKAKTAGAGGTTTTVLSSGLTEDTGGEDGSEGTDEVDALADAAITASSELATSFSGLAVIFDVNLVNTLVPVGTLVFYSDPMLTLSNSTRVRFSGTTMPGGITAGTWYRAYSMGVSGYNLTPDGGGALLTYSSAGTGVLLESEAGSPASSVKSSKGLGVIWKAATGGDWGDNEQGYWQIPEAQAGIANVELKPWIQFDFGSARQLKFWRLMSLGERGRERMVRLVVIFSSPDNATWKHETFFEIPPVGEQYCEALIPSAQSARYWRICVRTHWTAAQKSSMLKKVRAYTGSRNWWQDGWVTFDAATATAALRSVRTRVLASYAGKIVVSKLPAAPANGDTFVIERDCGKTWNACCAKLNWAQFGGFDSIPKETVQR